MAARDDDIVERAKRIIDSYEDFIITNKTEVLEKITSYLLANREVTDETVKGYIQFTKTKSCFLFMACTNSRVLSFTPPPVDQNKPVVTPGPQN